MSKPPRDKSPSVFRASPRAADRFVEAAGSGNIEDLCSGMYNKHLGPDTRNANGTPALINAARQNQKEAVSLLLGWKADPGLTDSFDRTALIEAAAAGHGEIVDRLLVKGAQINQLGYRNITALMVATMNGHLSVMQKLLDKGANPDFQNVIGKTALMMAASEKNAEAVEILLKGGADTTFKNNADQTFWDIAPQYFSNKRINRFKSISQKMEKRLTAAAVASAESFLQPVPNR